jgi:hypothetical protein
VQLNDPDPFIWVSIYLVIAIFSLVSIFRKIPRLLLYGFGIVLLFYASMHIEYFIAWLMSENKSDLFGEMKEDKIYLEGTREFLGLVIALAALAWIAVQQKTHPVKNGF